MKICSLDLKNPSAKRLTWKTPHTSSVLGIAVSKEGKNLITLSANQLVVRNFEGNELDHYEDSSANYKDVALSDDGKQAVTCSQDTIIKWTNVKGAK